MKKFKQPFSFLAIAMSVFMLASCELIEDAYEDHKDKDKENNFVGRWVNDSLETKYYEDSVLVSSSTTLFYGDVFEVKENGSYATYGPGGELYNEGTWRLVKNNGNQSFILNEGTTLERSYDILVLNENCLVSNRKVVDGSSTVEYTFTYHK